MFKVGIVGCGGIGAAHARSWNSIEDVKVTTVVDLDLKKAQELATSIDAIALNDIKDLPQDLDVISVVTPPQSHYRVVKNLLVRKFNVFAEKPLTLDVKEGEELIELAQKNQVELGVGFKMRFESIFVEAKKLLPEIGELVSFTTNKEQMFNPRVGGEWVTKVGAMYELSIHDFDLLSYITGLFPKKVLFSQLKYKRNWEKEDSFVATVDYGKNITALLSGMYCQNTTFCFRDFTITFHGEKGYMRVERPDRIIMHTDQYRVIDVAPAEKSAFVLELEHFKDAILGKCKNTLTATDAVAMTSLIEEIRSKSML